MTSLFGRMRDLQRGAPQGGFSLIEVLIAMLVLSVGAASLLSLFAAAAATHQRAVDRTNAALVAERILSELGAEYSLGREPASILESLTAKLPEKIDGYGYDVVLFHPQGEGWSEHELFVRVTVHWEFTGSRRAEKFHGVLLPKYSVGETAVRRSR
jgi:prepilin-type N-terminal cleavage/methylation domain-containing protein